MPLDPVVRDNINKQMNAERYNAVFYKACEARLDTFGFRGFARWMHRASKDERKHAQWFMDYLIDRGAVPSLDALDAYIPPTTQPAQASSVLFREALKAEQRNTQAINFLYNLSDESHDPQTCIFLHWFIDDQTESEATLKDIVAQLDMLNGDTVGIRALDDRLRKHDHV